MNARRVSSCVAACLGACLLASPSLYAQTYRHTWTTTADFEGATQINVNARVVPDQLQLNLNQIETPYLWVANSGSNTVARIDTATGRVLSVTPIDGGGPSRTAVDIDFNCWVSLREDSNGRAFKLSAQDGRVLGVTPYVGAQTRGVAINAAGDVWVSSSVNDGQGYGWAKVNPETFEVDVRFQNNYGSYGQAIDPFGRIFATTSWLDGGRSIQRINSENGDIEQTWNTSSLGGDGYVYGITVDINGDAWGASLNPGVVVWFDGAYQCPNGQRTCNISVNQGIKRVIDVGPSIRAVGGVGPYWGRGIAVDANGFVWAAFNDVGTAGWTGAVSYLVKIDGTTGDPVQAVRVGTGAVGLTPDADGFVWVVHYGGGGENFQNFPCPNGTSGNGTVTKVRSSDGSIVGTYPTCGNSPYTYSDMAGYNLRSVTLRSGTWRAVHDSGRDGLEWGRVDWRGVQYPDTLTRIRVRASESQAGLANQPFSEFTNGANLPLRGRFIEVEVFFFTRNDFLGPQLEDLTLSSVCIPEPEVCDGFDNDCDGVVDNGNPGGGQACQTGFDGVCARGIRTCDLGEYECRPAQDPVAEVCDGQDNNCNGTVDEGVTNQCGACGPVPREACDGVDNDCNGLVDEGVTNACGGCGPVPDEACDGDDNDCDGLVDEGLVNACGQCGPAPEEICDGEDNDCDGLVDEGVANRCGECGPEPEEVCDSSDNDCDGLVDEGLINLCGTCGPAPAEVCDGLDNNCNGRVDEGALNACGFCGEAPTEVCDGFDNDCDGQSDEGLTNACGGCGQVPSESCNGVDDDCDGQTDEGVTNACGGCGLVDVEVCDGRDNDCDGQTDEGTTNACGGCGPLSPDVCDGVDNDCDGDLDEDPDCLQGQECVQGECAQPCAAGECPSGFVCVEDACLRDRCVGLNCADGQACVRGECVDENELACAQVECEGEQVCVRGVCQGDPCEGVECQEGQSCWLGQCREAGEVLCLQTSCGVGEVCQDGACVADPCAQVRCASGEACEAGQCVDACETMQCVNGFLCRQGQCVEDRCFNVVCAAGQSCVEGNCVFEACVGVTCEAGEQCGPQGCEPLGTCGQRICQDDQVCVQLQCVDKSDLGSEGNNGSNNGSDNNGSNNNGSDNNGAGGDDGGAGATPQESGCACASAQRRRAPWGLMGLAALAGALGLRRRSRQGPR
jgi:MYXO-CTERM domain-containing protein